MKSPVASLTLHRKARVTNGGDGTDLLTITTAGGEVVSIQVLTARGPMVRLRVRFPRGSVRVERGEGDVPFRGNGSVAHNEHIHEG